MNRLAIIKIKSCEECPFSLFRITSEYWGYYQCNKLHKKTKEYCDYSSEGINEASNIMNDWFTNLCPLEREK